MSLRRNTLWNLAGAGAPLFVALFSIPYLLRVLGADGFGVLTLIWALIGYFSLFDFGVGRALTYELARRSSSPLAEVAPYLRAGLALTAASGLGGAAIVAILASPLTSSWLNIRPDWQTDALISFTIAAAGIIPTTVAGGLRGALEGLNRFPASNINRSAVGVMMFALPAWSLHYHGSILWIVTTYLVVGRMLVLLVMLYQLRHLILIPGRLRLEDLKALVNYGAWITVTGIVGPLMVYGDRFFVSAAVGAEYLPQYAIPQEALQRLLLIPTAVCGALLPQLVTLSREKMNLSYHRNSKKIGAWMLGICFVAAILMYPVLSFWISSTFARSALPVALVLIVGVWLNSVAMVPYTVIQAMGHPKITAMFHVAEMLIYIALVWILTMQYGLVGAAMAWTARVAIDLLLLRIATRRILSGK